MILARFLKTPLDRIQPRVGIVAFLTLFGLTFPVAKGYVGIGPLTLPLPEALYQTKWLFPFGFPSPDFYSADYYALFPWFFMFLAGCLAGRMIIKVQLPRWAYRRKVLVLGWLGKRPLPIYLIHQPVFFGIMWSVMQLIER
jgi:uncharacterized membrane protein